MRIQGNTDKEMYKKYLLLSHQKLAMTEEPGDKKSKMEFQRFLEPESKGNVYSASLIGHIVLDLKEEDSGWGWACHGRGLRSGIA